MKNSAHSYTLPRFIETAHMHKALVHLCGLTFAILGDNREVLRNARRVAKQVRELIKAEEHNRRTLLKWEMLLTPAWRERVLRELGGAKALKRWERSSGRAAQRRAGIKMLKPHASPAQRTSRAANLKKAKAALREKISKSPRIGFWNNSHGNVYKDPCKVDMAGQFRLAPITRGPRIVKTQVKLKPTRLGPGVWQTKPSAKADSKPKTRLRSVKILRINPIPLWPLEFEATDASSDAKDDISIAPQAYEAGFSHLSSKLVSVQDWESPKSEGETFKPP